ncbi:MAG TPA: hypothetical protein PKB07_26860 [Flavilitoribacter sp.]|nr:hypothetical protein [Flavilitoribacter sp.]
MTVSEAFGDVADMLAQMDPGKILALKPSAAMTDRVEELIYKKKNEEISPEERMELERFLALDMFINLAKVRARGLLKE